MFSDVTQSWVKALLPSFTHDRALFLLGTLIPLSYLEYVRGNQYGAVLIDLQGLPNAEGVIKVIVNAGMGKVANGSLLCLGKVSKTGVITYFFETPHIQEDKVSDKVVILKDRIAPFLASFEDYCSRSNGTALLEFIKSRLRFLFSPLEKGREWVGNNAAEFAAIMQTIVSQSDTVARKTTPKEGALGKLLVETYGTVKAAEIILFFHTQYDSSKLSSKGINVIWGFRDSIVNSMSGKRVEKKKTQSKQYTEDA